MTGPEYARWRALPGGPLSERILARQRRRQRRLKLLKAAAIGGCLAVLAAVVAIGAV